MMTKSQNWALLVLRVIIAAIFLVAAYAKIALWPPKENGQPKRLNPIL